MQTKGFFEKVYKIVKQIPEGKVVTYGQIAEALGTLDARRIGHALHANKDSLGVSCHRVVKKDGGLAPGYAFGGPGEQKMRLMAEKISFIDKSHVDLKKHLWRI